MPIGKVASRDLAPRAGNALHSYVMAEQFATPDRLLRQVRACKLQEAFLRDRVALAHTLEEVLQYHIAQREGLRDHSILRQRRSEEMRKAVALFEREVWTGAFLPKWERIVAEVAKRKRVRARRKGAKMEEEEEVELADAAAEDAAPVAVTVAVVATARPVAAAAAPASAPLPPAPTLPPPQHPLVWDTSIRGRFTPASGRMLKQWFVDHIQDPYPSDYEKHVLARAARVAYDQVSAWFINARMRLWKKMLQGLQDGTYQQSPEVARATKAAAEAAEAEAEAGAGVGAGAGAAAGAGSGAAFSMQHIHAAAAARPSRSKKKSKGKNKKRGESSDDSSDGEYVEEDDDEDEGAAKPTRRSSRAPKTKSQSKAAATKVKVEPGLGLEGQEDGDDSDGDADAAEAEQMAEDDPLPSSEGEGEGEGDDEYTNLQMQQGDTDAAGAGIYAPSSFLDQIAFLQPQHHQHQQQHTLASAAAAVAAGRPPPFRPQMIATRAAPLGAGGVSLQGGSYLHQPTGHAQHHQQQQQRHQNQTQQQQHEFHQQHYQQPYHHHQQQQLQSLLHSQPFNELSLTGPQLGLLTLPSGQGGVPDSALQLAMAMSCTSSASASASGGELNGSTATAGPGPLFDVGGAAGASSAMGFPHSLLLSGQSQAPPPPLSQSQLHLHSLHFQFQSPQFGSANQSMLRSGDRDRDRDPALPPLQLGNSAAMSLSASGGAAATGLGLGLGLSAPHRDAYGAAPSGSLLPLGGFAFPTDSPGASPASSLHYHMQPMNTSQLQSVGGGGGLGGAGTAGLFQSTGSGHAGGGFGVGLNGSGGMAGSGFAFNGGLAHVHDAPLPVHMQPFRTPSAETRTLVTGGGGHVGHSTASSGSAAAPAFVPAGAAAVAFTGLHPTRSGAPSPAAQTHMAVHAHSQDGAAAAPGPAFAAMQLQPADEFHASFERAGGSSFPGDGGADSNNFQRADPTSLAFAAFARPS